MGKMKELQTEMMNLEFEWRHLLAAILGQVNVGNVSVMKPDDWPSDEEEWEQIRFVPDLAFTPLNADEPVAVEFKMFRWRSDWRSRVGDAIAFMKDLLKQGPYARGLLIVPVEIDDEDATVLRKAAGPDIDIWDLNHLRHLAAADTQLLDQLEQIASETRLDDDRLVSRRRTSDTERGATIAARLRETPAGKPGWQVFERTCHEAIRFLFDRELHNLVAQQHTYDGLNRMDLIGRIRPERESFWAMLASDFATRYVVFEAKNYAEAIGQQAIDITSKYLFRAGLRTVAIVIAREGGSERAMRASASHLREDRKFIMVISMDDLCAMLKGADAGDPPENLLFSRMDQSLMSMGR